MDYKTYKEFRENFNLSQRWAVFAGGRHNLNIARECIDRHPTEKTAIRIKFDDGRREAYRFGELSRLTSQFANMLERRGVGAGEPVAVVLNPSLEFYVSFFGILKRGAVVVPCSPLFGPEAIAHRVNKADAKMVIVPQKSTSLIKNSSAPYSVIAEELLELLQKEGEHYPINTSADTLAFLQFSSGTTGSPKAVPYGHKAATLAAVHIKFGIGLRQNDNYFCPSSPAWGMGIWYGTVGPLIFGKAIGTYSGKFDAGRLLEALEEFEVTNLFAAPLVYRRIMESGKLDNYRLRLRRMTYTGGKLDMDIIEYFQERPGLTIQSCYGSTEVGVILADYDFDDWKVKPGSLGMPLPGRKVAVIDEAGSEVPQGEVGQVAIGTKDGWIRMGDAAYVDEDGYFWYKSRIDDIIISAGYTIGPIEIENVLEKHPAVREAAVVGSPDKERGEVVKAFIIPNREPTAELKREIQEFVKTRLSKHEYPREIEFVSELPRTPDGKIKRKELKAREYQRVNKLVEK
ncbi:MAG: acyl-CoA synthetase [Dehalococcoidales bacterium]